MALNASLDTRGRDVEIGIDAEYSPDEDVIPRVLAPAC
jgi:hypothetical protein